MLELVSFLGYDAGKEPFRSQSTLYPFVMRHNGTAGRAWKNEAGVELRVAFQYQGMIKSCSCWRSRGGGNFFGRSRLCRSPKFRLLSPTTTTYFYKSGCLRMPLNYILCKFFSSKREKIAPGKL